ncbi:OLC1v1021064C1 [Oldenlandia corymbosa var. corymbosa]|uniref:OLC1v1021064C1 n=1 Tax=Oldenlandia corymbosa var. corymbosa TaxID=529605 RepID=A0AAV1BXA5_OLDCO|nr:OLC1v1021064C1 [Oldenlandia corymbosa var. corymbosa]
MAERGGKDDSSAKSKMGRKVQIDFEDSLEPVSPKSNGKTDPPVIKGDRDKSGKGGKAAGGGKNLSTKALAHEFKVEEELPKKTKCLMDCEAADILQGIQEKMVVLSADPAIKLPTPFDRGLMYSKRRGISADIHAVQQILQPLKKYGLSQSVICVIGNLKVESADEVFALVPSLKDKKAKLREPLRHALDKLAKLER